MKQDMPPIRETIKGHEWAFDFTLTRQFWNNMRDIVSAMQMNGRKIRVLEEPGPKYTGLSKYFMCVGTRDSLEAFRQHIFPMMLPN